MISVCTIVHGRARHLANQAAGLAQSTILPDEWIVIGMNESTRIPQTAIPTVFSRLDAASALPLAEARNMAADLATGDTLIFLDVDCIPSSEMVEHLAKAATEDTLWMGDVRYLPTPLAAAGSVDNLDEVAEAHPKLPLLSAGQRLCPQPHEKFWSLCFALPRDMWDRIGGFDDQYAGYGGEDTDFAFSARDAGVPFGFVGARCYHQYHESFDPPLNHFEAIVLNAERFRAKWGTWPMEAWLTRFAEMGLLVFDINKPTVRTIRQPTRDEVRAARSLNAAGF